MNKTIKTNIYLAILFCLATIFPANTMLGWPAIFTRRVANNSLLQVNYGCSIPKLSQIAKRDVKCAAAAATPYCFYKVYQANKRKLSALRYSTTPTYNKKNRQKDLISSLGKISSSSNILPKWDTTNPDIKKRSIFGAIWDLNTLPLVPWYIRQFSKISLVGTALSIPLAAYSLFKASNQEPEDQKYMLYGHKTDNLYKGLMLSSYLSWTPSLINSLATSRGLSEYADIIRLRNCSTFRKIVRFNNGSTIVKQISRFAPYSFCSAFLIEAARLVKRYWPRKYRIKNQFSDI